VFESKLLSEWTKTQILFWGKILVFKGVHQFDHHMMEQIAKLMTLKKHLMENNPF